MSGLLKRARKIRDNDPALSLLERKDDGFSPEDKRDILKEIDHVSQKNKIQVSPRLFHYTPLKRGVFLPVIVNLLAVALVVGAFFLFTYLSERDQEKGFENQAELSTAEAKVLQEMKREAEAALQAKNAEIQGIQAQMQQIDRDRRELADTMDKKIGDKERELRQEMEQRLAEERARLQEQGLSEEDIAARIEAFQAQRDREFEAQLAQYRQQAEEERRAAEEELDALKSRYDNSLQDLEQERQSLAREAEAREAELEGKLAEQRQAMEEEMARREAAMAEREEELTAEMEEEMARQLEEQEEALQDRLSAAEQEREETVSLMEQLRREKERADMLEAQIAGFYTAIRRTIDEGRYEEAEEQLAELVELLDRPDVKGLKALAERREADLYMVDTLEYLLEIEKANMVGNNSRIVQIENLVEEAAVLEEAGEKQEAAQLYAEAMNIIPAVNSGYAKLQGFLRSDYESQIEELRSRSRRELEAREKALLQEKEQALTAAEQKRIAAERERLAQEQEELEKEQARLDGLRRELEEAREAYDDGDYRNTINRYGAVLAYLPLKEGEKADLIEQITRAGVSLNDEYRTQESSEQAALEIMKGEQLLNQGEYSRALDIYKGVIRDYPASRQVSDALNGINTVLQREIEAREDLIQEMSAANSDLTAIYRQYAEQADQVLAEKGEAGLLEAKIYLDNFLVSEEVKEQLPGLYERIRRYDQAFEEAGRESALVDTIDIVSTLSELDTAEEKALYLEAELSDSGDEPVRREFLRELQKLIGGSGG